MSAVTKSGKIKLTKEIIKTYYEIIPTLKIVNKETRRRWMSTIKTAWKENNRVECFNIIAYVEDWQDRQKYFMKSRQVEGS